MRILIRTPLLANCLKKGGQNLFGFNGVSAMKQRSSFALIIAALILTAGYNAQGQTFTNYLWNNSSTIYANAGSWTNGVAPSGDTTARSNNIIEFSNFGPGNNNVSLSASNTVGTILFSSTANPYTFESTTSTVRLSTMRGITNNSTATQTFNLLLDTKDNNTWYQAAGGSMIFNTNVGLASIASSTGRTLTLTGGGTFDFKGSMTGGAGSGGTLVVNNSGGTVNLSASNLMTGMTLTSGTLNINNNNALGTGVFTLTGGATIDNTSGSVVVNAGNQAWTWNGTSALNFGSATNTAANNLNLGTGTVTLSGTRAVNLLGTGTKLTIGDVINTVGSSFTANGTGNTLEMRGLSLSTSATPVTVTLAGTANLNITGAIVNGAAPGSGLSVINTGTTTLSGNNAYTGNTAFGGGTNIISGDNSAAVGNVTISGSSTYVRLENSSSISSSSSLVGMGGTIAQSSTLDFKAAGGVTFNSYGSSSSAGGSMNFTNSSGSSKTVTFTNSDNYITASSSGARGLSIKSADLTLDFAGNIQNSSTVTQTTTFDGAGNFIVRGSLLDTTNATGIRTLAKTGAGTLTLQGASNNYSGPTLVSGGTLEVGAEGALPTNSGVTVSTGARLRFLKTSGAINLTNLTVASGGTLEQNLITITSSGAVNLTGSTLKVNGTPTLASYTLVSGAPLTGTPNLNPSISGYALRISGNNLLLEKVVTDAYALYLSNNNLPADTAFNAIIEGVTVGLKYAFTSANGMPQNNGVAAVPVMSGNQLSYTFDVKDDSALTVTYQTSTDLVAWTTAQAVSAGTGAVPTGFLKKQVQVTGSDKLFVRINVTR